MNESCHIWASHVTYEWVMSLMPRIHSYEWVIPYLYMSFIWSCMLWLNHTMSCHAFIHMNECNSCHVFIHTMNESYPIYICHSYEWVIPYLYMSFIWMRHTLSIHVIPMIMHAMTHSHHVMPCIHSWVSHVTYECVIPCLYMCPSIMRQPPSFCVFFFNSTCTLSLLAHKRHDAHVTRVTSLS